MNTHFLTEIENKLNRTLPESYKKLMSEFESFCVLEYREKEIDIRNINRLSSSIDTKSGLQEWQYLQQWTQNNAHKQPKPELVKRNDSSETLPKEQVANGFLFADGSDGVRLYFDIQDNMSVWEYWLDEGSVRKIADSFDELLSKSEIVEQE
ncbi:SMI1/KNR4 family protein [Capnocytophaga cynodegmi]|uniref:SMI1/KNR4 family protein n=1 Tax=Capnocytophaga cynodegmi TaxID=28189 RepID=UPI00385A0126